MALSALTPYPVDAEADIRHVYDRGDLAAAMTLALDRYGAELVGFIHVVVRDEDLARELFGELSERLWVSFEQFEWRSSFRTWAYRSARNLALTHVSRNRLVPVGESYFSRLPVAIRTTTQPHLRTENKDRLAKLRSTLSADDQMLLTLRIDRQMGWREIAEVFAQRGEAAGTAALRKRFERLKERLRAAAVAEGWLGHGE